jgi:hypothetical protein
MVAFGCLLYLAGRLLPIYFESKAVRSSLAAVAESGVTDPASVRSALSKAFAAADIHTITAADVDLGSADAGSRLEVSYDAVAPLVGSVGLVLHVHESAVIHAAETP